MEINEIYTSICKTYAGESESIVFHNYIILGYVVIFIIWYKDMYSNQNLFTMDWNRYLNQTEWRYESKQFSETVPKNEKTVHAKMTRYKFDL